jgi:hypothetical protein
VLRSVFKVLIYGWPVLLLAALFLPTNRRNLPEPIYDPMETRLDELSPRLLSQLWTSIREFNRSCPKDGSWSKHSLSPAVLADPFTQVLIARCESATRALVVLHGLAKSDQKALPQLFVYWVYIRDYNDLDHDKYLRTRVGPFLSRLDCENSQRLYSKTEVGVSVCRLWQLS